MFNSLEQNVLLVLPDNEFHNISSPKQRIFLLTNFISYMEIKADSLEFKVLQKSIHMTFGFLCVSRLR